MPSKVVNIRKIKATDNVIYIGRPSIWGNKFTIGFYGTREKVIRLYKTWFYIEISKNKEFREETLKLIGKDLGCFCHPLPCHGDIIVEYLNKIESDQETKKVAQERFGTLIPV